MEQLVQPQLHNRLGQALCITAARKQETDQVVARLECRHTFHLDCLDALAVSGGNDCPNCRYPSVEAIATFPYIVPEPVMMAIHTPPRVESENEEAEEFATPDHQQMYAWWPVNMEPQRLHIMHTMLVLV